MPGTLSAQALYRLGTNADLRAYLEEAFTSELERVLRLDTATQAADVLDAHRKLQILRRLVRDVTDLAETPRTEKDR